MDEGQKTAGKAAERLSFAKPRARTPLVGVLCALLVAASAHSTCSAASERQREKPTGIESAQTTEPKAGRPDGQTPDANAKQNEQGPATAKTPAKTPSKTTPPSEKNAANPTKPSDQPTAPAEKNRWSEVLESGFGQPNCRQGGLFRALTELTVARDPDGSAWLRADAANIKGIRIAGIGMRDAPPGRIVSVTPSNASFRGLSVEAVRFSVSAKPSESFHEITFGPDSVAARTVLLPLTKQRASSKPWTGKPSASNPASLVESKGRVSLRCPDPD